MISFLDWLDEYAEENYGIDSYYFLEKMLPENQNWIFDSNNYETRDDFLDKNSPYQWILNAFNWRGCEADNYKEKDFIKLDSKWRNYINTRKGKKIIFESIKRQKLKITFEGD